MRNDEMDIRDLLPLPLATFHILVSLRVEARHGYAIMQDVAERTDGGLELSAGTLYRSVHRMREQGLIEEVRDPAIVGGDGRRRCYRITEYGERVARAEVARLADLIGYARATGLAPEGA